jgi:hypothetical protein
MEADIQWSKYENKIIIFSYVILHYHACIITEKVQSSNPVVFNLFGTLRRPLLTETFYFTKEIFFLWERCACRNVGIFSDKFMADQGNLSHKVFLWSSLHQARNLLGFLFTKAFCVDSSEFICSLLRFAQEINFLRALLHVDQRNEREEMFMHAGVAIGHVSLYLQAYR